MIQLAISTDDEKLKEMQKSYGYTFSEAEFSRLKNIYGSYSLPHRELIIDVFSGKVSIDTLLTDKIDKKHIQIVRKQAHGPHKQWANERLRRTFFRLIYLRYRLDEKKSQRESNAALLKIFTMTAGQSVRSAQKIISEATKGALLKK